MTIGSDRSDAVSAVATCDLARETVVWDRLPRGGRTHPRTHGRPGVRIVVERAHANADPLGMLVVACEDRRSARATEPFLATVVGLPAPEEIVAGNNAEGVDRGMSARRGRRARSPLAATAMAVARAEKLSRHLIADRPAVAATGNGSVGIRPSSRFRHAATPPHCAPPPRNE